MQLGSVFFYPASLPVILENHLSAKKSAGVQAEQFVDSAIFQHWRSVFANGLC
jgi:hypothetical protein